MDMKYINKFEIQGVVSYVREEDDVTKFFLRAEAITPKDGAYTRTGADISCQCAPGTSLKEGQVVHVTGYFTGYNMWVNCFLTIEK